MANTLEILEAFTDTSSWKVYKVWRCKNCGTSINIVYDEDWQTWEEVGQGVACCNFPKIDRADENIAVFTTRLPGDTEPKPRDRVELVLEDMEAR